MRIHEAWEAMKRELEEEYAGITIGEYGYTERSGLIIRGPHVTLMIPAEVDGPCPHCGGKIKEQVPMPTELSVRYLLSIVNRYLCDVTWDGKSPERENHAGGNYKGVYYKITFDKE
jgi:hypothetical protein